MRSRLPSVLLLVGMGVSVALGGDDADTASAKAAVAQFDAKAPKAKDDTVYGELVMELSSARHELTVERLGRILLKDADEDHRMIASDALSRFTSPAALREAAGKALTKAIVAEVGPESTDSCILAVGALKYAPAVPALCEIIRKGGDPWLMVTTVRACGQIGDLRALPRLLELWERYPVGLKFPAGEEVVHEHGTNESAEAEYKEKNKNGRRGGKPPVMFRAWMQELGKAILRLTNDRTVESPDLLRAWMEARADELKKLGIEIPKRKTGRSDAKK